MSKKGILLEILGILLGILSERLVLENTAFLHSYLKRRVQDCKLM